MPASIRATQNGSEKNVFTFEVTDLPALTPNPEQPAPFYQVFWDFGDGNFSTDSRPSHTYPAADGIYTPTARIKKINDNSGGAIPDISTSINISTQGGGQLVTQPVYSSITLENDRAGIKIIYPPMPGQQIYCLFSYHNPAIDPMSDGRLVLQYNESVASVVALNFDEAIASNGEIHSVINNPAGSGYSNELEIEFSEINIGQYRNLCAFFDVSNNAGDITNLKLNLQVFDSSNNLKGSAQLSMPIVNDVSSVEDIIGDDVTIAS